MGLNLDAFNIPDVAREALEKHGLTEQPLGDGVSVMSGHDRGVAYRFFIHPEYNKQKSETLGYEYFDEYEMVEWLRDKRSKPVERVKFLPETLLTFSAEGDCVGGKYAEAYKRFKEGRKAAGMPLAKWGLLSEGQVATLEKAGIFSVEQFAETPREKINGHYPQEYLDAFDRAIQWVYGQEARENAAETANKVDELMSQNSVLMTRLEELEGEKKKLESKVNKPKAKSKAKAKARPAV